MGVPTEVSPVGRTRTAPAPDSAVPLRIAFSSCQHYNSGYFSAHAHAATDAFDLYLFLGDYIYERGARHFPATCARTASRPWTSPPTAASTALARDDPGLRELHRLHPALHVWDDHEVENNYSDDLPAPAALQRDAGYRAAFEWIPRVVNPRTATGSTSGSRSTRPPTCSCSTRASTGGAAGRSAAPHPRGRRRCSG